MRPLVVFDLDGVLIDSRQANVEAFSYGLEKMGLGRPPAEAVSRLIGRPALDMLALLGCPRERCAEVFSRWVEPYYLRHLPELARPMPGAREALQALAREGARIGACTSGSRTVQEAALEAVGLRGSIERLHTPCQSGFRKPDPRFLRELIEQFGEVERVLHVEDTEEGIQMGQACGAVTLYATYGFGRLAGCRPDFHIDHLGQVPEILGRLLAAR
ncbi:MAG TPA: HAD family hydrolase [Candidatus Nitrosotenuis sp.]|nr:HAD family hydrolase [Candidatus Nitrosotenuis sp.]